MVIWTSVPSHIVNIWWIALVSPIETLILLLNEVILVELIPLGESPAYAPGVVLSKAVPPVETPILRNEDSNLKDFSVPGAWPESLNLCVPTPTAVVPNPTILDLTLTELVPVFS